MREELGSGRPRSYKGNSIRVGILEEVPSAVHDLVRRRDQMMQSNQDMTYSDPAIHSRIINHGLNDQDIMAEHPLPSARSQLLVRGIRSCDYL